jgi:hypothetical protein
MIASHEAHGHVVHMHDEVVPEQPSEEQLPFQLADDQTVRLTYIELE